MDIPQPNKHEITVYSKSGCPNCVNVKKLLKDKVVAFSVINCDEFIYEDKVRFLEFIHNLAGKEYKVFPMVFNGLEFIGGFKETQAYFNKQLDFTDSDF
jgi:glutaredoxin